VHALQWQLQVQKDPLAKMKQPARTPLSGVLASILQCQVCGGQRAIAEASVCISATLRAARRQRKRSEETVEECVDSFFHKESVDNVECSGVGCRLVERLKRQVVRGASDAVLESTRAQIEAAMIPGFEDALWRSVEQILSARRSMRHHRLRGGSPGAAGDGVAVAAAAGESGELGAASSTSMHHNDETWEDRNALQELPLPRRKHSKWYEMTRAPQVLCVQLQRRHFDMWTGRERKLTDHIQFQERLCMEHFAADNSDERVAVVWRLSSVVVHFGLRFGQGGHYVVYRRNVKMPDEANAEKEKDNKEEEAAKVVKAAKAEEEQGDGGVGAENSNDAKGDSSGDRAAGADPPAPPAPRSEWIYASDHEVRDADWDEVRRQEAYLLFYEQVEGGDDALLSAFHRRYYLGTRTPFSSTNDMEDFAVFDPVLALTRRQ